MLHAVIAFAATVALPSLPPLSTGPALSVEATPATCAAGIDPSFTRYVPPAKSTQGTAAPNGVDPQWLPILANSAPGLQFSPLSAGCVRLIQVHADR